MHTVNLPPAAIPSIALPAASLPHIAPRIPADTVDTVAIMNAIVLWYSPSRQGCTNENMAENPILTDLSGNGRHMTCYNFAWTPESGIAPGGWLVLDGATSFCSCPTTEATSLTDFTLIANRKIHPPKLYQKTFSGLHHAFRCETWSTTKSLILQSYDGPQSEISSIHADGIIWMTPTAYQNHTTGSPVIPLERGNSRPPNRNSFMIGHYTWDSITYGFTPAEVKFSSYLIFNRSLTDPERRWVINNLID